MVKVEEYDKEEEERRLFYVAISRAKTNLYLTYTKKPTYFIKENMIKIIKGLKSNTQNKLKENQAENQQDADLLEKLKSWRKEISKEQNLPAYCIVNNKTLDEIKKNRPQDFYDLLKIGGMGEIKVERYGGQILRIVNEGDKEFPNCKDSTKGSKNK